MLKTHEFLPAREYTLGFAFSSDFSKVLLIQKNRPIWQEGKLNGIGGKLEECDQTPIDGMIREFKEETNIDTSDCRWQFISNHFKPGLKDYDPESYTVFIFATVLSKKHMAQLKQNTDEALIWANLDRVTSVGYKFYAGENYSNNDFIPFVPGSAWYICMAEYMLGKNMITTTMEMI